MSRTDPTPVTNDLNQREYYEFHIMIEGHKFVIPKDREEETVRLANSLRGTLAKTYPERWSSVVDAKAVPSG